jgi:ribosomal protein L23
MASFSKVEVTFKCGAYFGGDSTKTDVFEIPTDKASNSNRIREFLEAKFNVKPNAVTVFSSKIIK